MTETLIPFAALPWEVPQPGVRQKVYLKGNQRLRLLNFQPGFVEPDWCHKGHVGYVVKGEMQVEFDAGTRHFKAGDGLWIEAGPASRHKVRMTASMEVELILFESIS